MQATIHLLGGDPCVNGQFRCRVDVASPGVRSRGRVDGGRRRGDAELSVRIEAKSALPAGPLPIDGLKIVTGPRYRRRGNRLVCLTCDSDVENVARPQFRLLMDGLEFKARLRILRRTQVGFAAEIGVAPRTVHYWADRGPPNEIAYLLDMLALVELPFGPNVSVSDSCISSQTFSKRVELVVDRLVGVAVENGRLVEFKKALRDWVEANFDDSTGAA